MKVGPRLYSFVQRCSFKAPLLALAVSSALLPGAAHGLGIFGGFVILSTNGGTANTFYDTDQATPNPDFSGSLFTISGGTSLLLGGQVTTFPGAGNVNGADVVSINYRLDAGSFNALGLPFARNVNANNDDQWERLPGNGGAQLGNRLDVGTHTLSTFFRAQDTNGNGGTVFLNNGGLNYSASFTVTAGTFNYTGTSGNLSDQTKYAGGLAPGNGHNLQFNSASNPAALNNDSLTSAASLSFGSGNQTLSGNALAVTSGNVAVSSGGTATLGLTLSGANGLSKSGEGTLALTVTNIYSGATTVNAGTLQAGVGTLVNVAGPVVVNAGGTLLLSGTGQHIGASIPVTLNGGTFNTGGFSETGGTGTGTIGALTLQGSSTIDFGTGISSVLNFANSSMLTWTGTLSILNWSGTLVTGNGTDQLEFGDNALAVGLSPTQLAMIQFVNPAGLAPGTYTAAFAVGDFSEVVPGVVAVPEPGTVAAGLLALGIVLRGTLRGRRRWRF